MKCECVEVPAGLICRHCQRPCDGDSERECPLRQASSAFNPLTEDETRELFDDPTLAGNRLADLFAALGFPPCRACDERREWLNRAHRWLRNDSENKP